MISKHYRWQTRWQIAAGLATHETGLRVRLADGRPAPENADEVRAALTPKHGHNAAAMIERLLREAAELLEKHRA